MNSGNDKTLRGLFCKHIIGRDEWNDRRDYRKEYESEFNLGANNPRSIMLDFGDMFLPFELDKPDPAILIRDKVADESDYMFALSKIMPELKSLKKFRYFTSFGMYREANGEYSMCDCCGVTHMNVINSSRRSGLCDGCTIERIPDFSI